MDQTKTILLVDDDVDFLIQTETVLKANGFTVVKAESQQEAETLLKELKPDLAILDLMMEHFDGGFSLAYHIKKQYSETPIILCSAVANETGISFDASTDEERSWIKADLFLPKPIRHEQLIREIKKLIEGK